MRRAELGRTCARYGLIAFGLLVFARAAASDAPDMADAQGQGELGFEEAIVRTLAHNPDLTAFGYQIQAQEGRVTQSGIKPVPELRLDVENTPGTGSYSGIRGAETTLSLGWVLERGKRQNYIAAARAGISVLEAQVEIRRLDAVTLSALLYLDNLEFQERYALSLQAVAAAERAVATLSERVEAARAPAADLARARAELASVRLYSADMEHDLTNARHLLSTQWGQVHPDFAVVSGDWRQLPALGSFEALAGQLNVSPDLNTFVSRRRLREAELRLAEIQARPDWRVSAGIRRLEVTDDYAFTFGFSVPFRAGESNRGQVQEAHANLGRLDAEQAAMRVRIEAQLFAIHHEMEHSLLRAGMLRGEVLPRLREAAEQTRKGYEAGRYSLFDVRQLESELLSMQSELVQASIDARRQQIEIERLTGAVMPPAAR